MMDHTFHCPLKHCPLKGYPLLVLLIASMFISSNSSARVNPDSIRDPYRHFIMPTAKAVDGGFIGFWELGLFQAGFGIDNVISLTGGFTMMPTVAFRSQFAMVNLKLTLFDEEGFTFAAGTNLFRMTSEHVFAHIFGSLTIETPTHTRYTGNVFYKIGIYDAENAGNTDFPIVNVEPYGSFTFQYGAPVGIGVGFDSPVAGYDRIRLIGEIWNHDMSQPKKLGLLGAVRIEGQEMSSDFGFMYFTLPLIVPVANFVYRF
jgi:hypothetical protein